MDEAAAVAANLSAVRGTIAANARQARRDPAAVTLVAVSKQQPDARIEAALAAGQRVFGENRVQEAAQRWAHRRAAFPDLRLHLIGPLQTNKVKEAVALFDVIETVDRPKLVEALAAEVKKSGRTPAFLVQVNTGEEPQKAGVIPDALPALLVCCAANGLAVDGLMCIPPVEEDPALHFALLADTAKRHGLKTLSMGMSEDYEVAVRFGATHVRVGSALFGARSPRQPAGEVAGG
jgi:pyridoxal phosphate enzyme (YggS family)